MERKGTEITIVATDIEIQISARAVCDNQGEAKSITVGARKLLDILRALPEQSEVTLALQEKKLQVKAAKSRFNLQTLPAEDFPKLSLAEGASTKMTLPQKVLKQLFLSVQYAMAQQDIRYYLNGLLLVSAGDKITVVATDGHRLALASAAHKIEGMQEVILPRKTILELSKLLSDSDDPVEVELSPTQARFTFGGIVLISKLVDGKFPDYTRVIPTTHNKKLLLNRVRSAAGPATRGDPHQRKVQRRALGIGRRQPEDHLQQQRTGRSAGGTRRNVYRRGPGYRF